jgi:hypothetical protein
MNVGELKKELAKHPDKEQVTLFVDGAGVFAIRKVAGREAGGECLIELTQTGGK